MGTPKDLSDQRFGRLVVLDQTPTRNQQKEWLWQCHCDCGTLVTVRGYCLTRGSTKSCGCMRGENGKVAWTKHGLTSTPEYNSWISMIRRCNDPNSEKYPDYGGRGIIVCDRWLNSIVDFVEDMPPYPGVGYTIDRISNDGNYEPGNCTWSTAEEQSNNRRNVKLFEHEGEMLSIAQIARKIGMAYSTLYDRVLRDNIPLAEAVIKDYLKRPRQTGASNPV